MNRMKYKGYAAEIEYSEEDRALVGRVMDIRDVIVFHSDNVDDLEKEFHGMIDFYLEQRAKDGIGSRIRRESREKTGNAGRAKPRTPGSGKKTAAGRRVAKRPAYAGTA